MRFKLANGLEGNARAKREGPCYDSLLVNRRISAGFSTVGTAAAAIPLNIRLTDFCLNFISVSAAIKQAIPLWLLNFKFT